MILSCVRFAVALAWMASLGMNSLPVRGAEFSLGVQLDAQRTPTLSLSGLSTGQYTLEASTNLHQWFSLATASAGPEPFRFVHAEASQLGTVFYRGVQLSDVAALLPQVDSNFVATGLITLQSGGTLLLTNESGVRYSFTVGPSNVVDTVAVRMQLVSNFTSFPYPNEMRTAVLFEPSGFEFHGAGLLEITFPTNLPFLKLSSFAFDASGRGFHLTPDLVASNRVRIPVTHFSGVGTGLWAPTDRTTAVSTFIESTRDRQSQEIAAIIAQERERVLSGEPPQLDLNAELLDRQQDYYDRQLKPFFAEAEKDCALAQTLTRETLGIERQSQLIGLTNGPASSFLGSETAKKWNCNCIAEAIKACEEGKISDKTLIRTLLAAEHESEVMGGGSALENCGLGSIDAFLDQALNKKLPCAPDWIGVVSYTSEGSRSWDCSVGVGGNVCSASASAALSFEADVERVELEDESFPPFFTKQTWHLKLFPQANGAYSKQVNSTVPTPCGAKIEKTQRITAGNSGPLDLEIIFTFEDGELTDFTIETALDGSLVLNRTDITTDVLGPCPGGDGKSFSSSKSSTGPLFMSPAGASMDEVTFTKKTPTSIEGTVTGSMIGMDDMVTPYSWKISLRRNGP